MQQNDSSGARSTGAEGVSTGAIRAGADSFGVQVKAVYRAWLRLGDELATLAGLAVESGRAGVVMPEEPGEQAPRDEARPWHYSGVGERCSIAGFTTAAVTCEPAEVTCAACAATLERVGMRRRAGEGEGHRAERRTAYLAGRAREAEQAAAELAAMGPMDPRD